MTLNQAFTNVLMNIHDTETVVAFIDKLRQADEDIEFLECLRAAGVDNWDGYSEAVEMMDERDAWVD